MALLLCTRSLMEWYAVVHGSDSALPAVDIYTYEAKDAKDAVDNTKIMHEHFRS